jgi:hypothetical protein|tara:strand:- start:463 stop:1380 length:918 start_codon:yes stop_codon:yes gene_type:complete
MTSHRRKKRKQKRTRIKNVTKTMYNPEQCSPTKGGNSISCLDEELLRKIAHIINKLKNKKLLHIDTSRGVESIHDDICYNIGQISDCSSEACWMNLKSIMDNLGPDSAKFKGSFKPLMPKKWIKDYNYWLSNSDIEKCLEQYTVTDNSFHFYGAVPMDFTNCSVSNLCNFDMGGHLKNNKTKIGIVFNTDPSTKSGKHWISMYVDMGCHNSPNYGIYYFDSYGDKPSKQVSGLIRKIQEQGASCKRKMNYYYNDYSFQKQDSQCGIYAIHFIKQMLDGKSFNNYLKGKLTDRTMIKLRDEYFVRL